MKLVLITKRTIKLTVMINLTKQYETAKKKANQFMKNGEISNYFEALLEMNKYKKLMIAVVAN